jgi:hypothetical protein
MSDGRGQRQPLSGRPRQAEVAARDAGCKLPTQTADGRSCCFCGAEITIADMNEHIYAAHMVA